MKANLRINLNIMITSFAFWLKATEMDIYVMKPISKQIFDTIVKILTEVYSKLKIFLSWRRNKKTGWSVL